jgi:hypothetical protein
VEFDVPLPDVMILVDHHRRVAGLRLRPCRTRRSCRRLRRCRCGSCGRLRCRGLRRERQRQ